MVTANHYFVFVWQGFEEIIESRHILQSSAYGHISSKDKNVGIRNFRALVEHMGVTEGGDFHGWISSME